MIYHALEKIMQLDLADRRLEPWIKRPMVKPAVESLAHARRVLIITGFCLGPELPETDGPLGAIVLGRALQTMGAEVIYICDSPVNRIIQALIDAAKAPARILCLMPSFQAAAVLEELHPSHLIAIERPGRNRDGDYLNARGLSVKSWNEPLDDLFLLPRGDWETLGIGDGGNEIGMGNVYAQLQARPDPFPRLATIVKVDHLITAGVSNWGAYALVAGLSLWHHRNLLHTAIEESQMLRAALRGGAVDGFSLKSELSVDGISLGIHQGVLRLFHQLIKEGLNRKES
ncbi:MAG: DUF4392 domain-containing protein [Candidatus Delongbacteria bacterium]|nr:DUF4392 domain-containing protein [Candidatus Delongbacteria bacterium]